MKSVQPFAATTLLLLGLSLLAYMVTVEGEPGALPLALVLAGGGWLAVLVLHRRRTRADD